MCGIYIKFDINGFIIKECMGEECKHRGPDETKAVSIKMFSEIDNNILMKFHRLAINDLTEKGSQPFIFDNVVYMCNGEIYNYLTLAEYYNIQLEGHSDCEIIGKLYNLIGFEEMVKRLDGVFTIILVDTKKKNIFIARDRRGVRSLYFAYNDNVKEQFGCASEMKCLKEYTNCDQFPHGHTWDLQSNEFKKYSINFQKNVFYNDGSLLYEYLVKAVEKRLFNKDGKLFSDRPIGALLSGGLDSSTIVSIIVMLFEKYNVQQKLKTFSIGMKGSDDLMHARLMAEYAGTDHMEIIKSKNEMLELLKETPQIIETPDTTTNRASTPMIALCKNISALTDVKVIFSGEGADELFGGYKSFRYAKTPDQFQSETERLVDELPLFDLKRGDLSVSCAGLELRVPFLDTEFVTYCMNMNPLLKMTTDQKMEKYELRQQFENLLPKEICWRRKEAFSDGVSAISDNNENILWYKIIQDSLEGDETPIQREKKYYMDTFLKAYPNRLNTFKKYWEHKLTKDGNRQEDPSALLLS